MQVMDFSKPENRYKRISDVPEDYLSGLKEFVKKSEYYPTFHLAPPHGLMNDPNGLCEIDGWYHIFYQWFPLGPVHGLKYWYHVKTKDFIHYIDLGIGMSPDSELDCCGCFTGMASQKDGEWKLYYTGVNKDKIQNVCQVSFDGNEIARDKKLCIAYDPKLTTKEFRDPCLFDNTFMLVGTQDLNGEGKIAIYRQHEGQFTFDRFLDLPEALSGRMIECPNLLSLNDDCDLLIFSPQGIESPDRFTFRNVFSVIYGIGKFNAENASFTCQKYAEIDNGFDFYAPQIFRDRKGRNILLGWLGNSKCVYPSDYEQWAHMMTIPREIWCQNGRLYQLPLEELKSLRDDQVTMENSVSLSRNSFEAVFKADSDFEVVLSNNRNDRLIFGGNSREYYLNRGETSHVFNQSYGTCRYAVRDTKKKQLIRMYVDHSAIEIFADEGSVVFTSRFYIDDLTSLHCTGCNGEIFYLKGIKYLNH